MAMPNTMPEQPQPPMPPMGRSPAPMPSGPPMGGPSEAGPPMPEASGPGGQPEMEAKIRQSLQGKVPPEQMEEAVTLLKDETVFNWLVVMSTNPKVQRLIGMLEGGGMGGRPPMEAPPEAPPERPNVRDRIQGAGGGRPPMPQGM